MISNNIVFVCSTKSNYALYAVLLICKLTKLEKFVNNNHKSFCQFCQQRTGLIKFATTMQLFFKYNIINIHIWVSITPIPFWAYWMLWICHRHNLHIAYNFILFWRPFKRMIRFVSSKFNNGPLSRNLRVSMLAVGYIAYLLCEIHVYWRCGLTNWCMHKVTTVSKI